MTEEYASHVQDNKAQQTRAPSEIFVFYLEFMRNSFFHYFPRHSGKQISHQNLYLNLKTTKCVKLIG